MAHVYLHAAHISQALTCKEEQLFVQRVQSLLGSGAPTLKQLSEKLRSAFVEGCSGLRLQGPRASGFGGLRV